jgi:uncharacterized protein involved in tolerance to divalent cations
MRIFKRRLTKKLENDEELQQAIKDGDKQIEDLKKAVKNAQEKGYKIPSYAKRYIKKNEN